MPLNLFHSVCHSHSWSSPSPSFPYRSCQSNPFIIIYTIRSLIRKRALLLRGLTALCYLNIAEHQRNSSSKQDDLPWANLWINEEIQFKSLYAWPPYSPLPGITQVRLINLPTICNCLPTTRRMDARDVVDKKSCRRFAADDEMGPNLPEIKQQRHILFPVPGNNRVWMKRRNTRQAGSSQPHNTKRCIVMHKNWKNGEGQETPIIFSERMHSSLSDFRDLPGVSLH